MGTRVTPSAHQGAMLASPRRLIFAALLVAVGFSVSGSARSNNPATSQDLEIYFIDVEGGQATLIVTPGRHSLLIDAGWAGDGQALPSGDLREVRDANRIVAATRDAGISQIDDLLITHFHADHVGGVAELSQLIPIRTFIDHGTINSEAERTSPENKSAFEAYLAVRAGHPHIEPRPGDRLPMEDLDVMVVSSVRQTLAKALPGAGTPNVNCSEHAIPAHDAYENPRSTGVVVRYGKFRFLDLGDLSGQPLFNLVCPRDLIGPVDAYLVPHHGGPDVADPATFAAFKPRVAIMNNGLTKGGSRNTYQALHEVPGLESVWQLDKSSAAGDANFPQQYIANLDETTAYWIKLVAREDGTFRVLNPRIGEWIAYSARDATNR